MDHRLEKLILKDFMCFEYKEFDLSKDLTAIIGTNGSGKSAAEEALALSFQVMERGSAVGNYVRKTPDDSVKKAYVDLYCTWMGKPLEIHSIFAGGNGRKITRTVKYDGEEYENMAANKFLSMYFEETAMRIAFALQGNEKFLKESKTENMKTLASLFKIDFDDDVEQIKEDIKMTTASKDALQVSLYKDLGSIEQLENIIKSTEEKIKANEEALSKSEDPKSIAELGEKIQAQRESYANLKVQFENYRNEKARALSIEATIKSLTEQIDAKTKAIENFVIENKDDPTELKEKKVESEKALEENIQLQRKLAVDSAHIKEKINAETNRINLISNGICPTCHQKVEGSLLEHDKAELEMLNKQLEGKVKELQEAEEKERKLSADISNYSASIIDIENHNREVEKAIQMLDRVKSEVEQLTKQKTDYVGMRISVPDEIDEALVENALKELNELQQEFNHSNNLEVAKRTLVSEISNDKASNEARKNQLKESKDVVQTTYDKIAEMETDLKMLSKAQYVYSACPRIFLKMICQTLEKEITKTVRRFGYDKMIIEVDEKGIEFYLVKPGDIKLNYAMLSSFERNLTNLALISILETFFNMPFICIDELDASADTQNTEKLNYLISEMMKDAQVVAISHDDSLVSKWVQESASLSIIDLSNKQVTEE